MLRVCDKCFTKNADGVLISKKHYIIHVILLIILVEFAPVLRIPRKRLGQALQFDMDLECHIEAYPPPAIRWYDGEGRLIRNNQHFRISHFTFDDEYVNTILR